MPTRSGVNARRNWINLEGGLFGRTRRYKDMFDVSLTKWVMKGRNFHQMDDAPIIKDAIPHTVLLGFKFILTSTAIRIDQIGCEASCT